MIRRHIHYFNSVRDEFWWCEVFFIGRRYIFILHTKFPVLGNFFLLSIFLAFCWTFKMSRVVKWKLAERLKHKFSKVVRKLSRFHLTALYLFQKSNLLNIIDFGLLQIFSLALYFLQKSNLLNIIDLGLSQIFSMFEFLWNRRFTAELQKRHKIWIFDAESSGINII